MRAVIKTKTGTTSWDEAVNSVVTHKKWGFFRTVSCVTIVFVVGVIIGILNQI